MVIEFSLDMTAGNVDTGGGRTGVPKGKVRNRERGHRIWSSRMRLNMTGEEFAAAVNAAGGRVTSHAAVAHWEAGYSPTLLNMRAISRITGNSIDYFETGAGGEECPIPGVTTLGGTAGRGEVLAATGDVHRGEINEKISTEHIDDLSQLGHLAAIGDGVITIIEIAPRLSQALEDTRDSSREAVMSHAVVKAKWGAPHDYTRYELKVEPDYIGRVEVVSDSMIPTLLPGDRVLIDLRHTEPSPDGVYAFLEGNWIVFQRIRRKVNSDPPEVLLSCDNPVDRTVITRLAKEVHPIGRVVEKIQRL